MLQEYLFKEGVNGTGVSSTTCAFGTRDLRGCDEVVLIIHVNATIITNSLVKIMIKALSGSI